MRATASESQAPSRCVDATAERKATTTADRMSAWAAQNRRAALVEGNPHRAFCSCGCRTQPKRRSTRSTSARRARARRPVAVRRATRSERSLGRARRSEPVMSVTKRCAGLVRARKSFRPTSTRPRCPGSRRQDPRASERHLAVPDTRCPGRERPLAGAHVCARPSCRYPRLRDRRRGVRSRRTIAIEGHAWSGSSHGELL